MLFRKLYDMGLLDKYLGVIDWLFDDNKFLSERGWTKGKVSCFTKRIKKYLNSIDCDYSYGIKNIKVYDQPSAKVVRMISADSEGKSLIKHIRNSIAHSHMSLYYVDKDIYFELFDVRKINEETFVRAYISLPFECLRDFYNIYNEIKLSINNDKNITKKERVKVKLK